VFNRTGTTGAGTGVSMGAGAGRGRKATYAAMLVSLLSVIVLVGCEVDSFLDPSVVGRWERTPVVLPILDRLDVIEEAGAEVPGMTKIRPEDLLPDTREYIIGTGDLLTISVFELINPNVESVQTRRVDEVGMVRLPVIGAVHVSGLTASTLELRLAQVLESKGVLKNPTVTVIVQEGRQNTFSIIGEPSSGGTAVGTYTILHPDFRLLDALALARGVPGNSKRLLIIRQAFLRPAPAPEGVAAPGTVGAPAAAAPAASKNPADLIDDLMKAGDATAASPKPTGAAAKPAGAAPPQGLDVAVESRDNGQWVNVDGKWVRTASKGSSTSSSPAPAAATGAVQLAPTEAALNDAALSEIVTQRIIEVPYDRLLEGDMRYNLVIRPGDIIRVPSPSVGNVYVMGSISRPGTFLVPGNRDLTLKNLIAAAGGLAGIAIPERVDIIRRVGNNQEATVRVNLREIFDGVQPDFYLKANDQVNIGTNFAATPLAVFRNGLRMTYGFGFILDRNFEVDAFGAAAR
jgi:polysaccharide biosynthesis/export protein